MAKFVKCAECGYAFPTELLNRMFVGRSTGSGYTEEICPMCAKVHGTNRKCFKGKIAQNYLKKALKIKEKQKKQKGDSFKWLKNDQKELG